MADRFAPGELEQMFRDAAARALDDLGNDLATRSQEAAPMKHPEWAHNSGALPGNLKESISKGPINPQEHTDGIEVQVSTGESSSDYAEPIHEGFWKSTGATFKHTEPYKYMEQPLLDGIPDYEAGFAAELDVTFPR